MFTCPRAKFTFPKQWNFFLPWIFAFGSMLLCVNCKLNTSTFNYPSPAEVCWICFTLWLIHMFLYLSFLTVVWWWKATYLKGAVMLLGVGIGENSKTIHYVEIKTSFPNVKSFVSWKAQLIPYYPLMEAAWFSCSTGDILLFRITSWCIRSD